MRPNDCSATEAHGMGEAPAVIDGFIRALCAIANGAYPEGGMSCTYQRGAPAPPDLPATAPSEDRLLAVFFDVALGNLDATAPDRRGHLVWELRRVVREGSGAELVAARVEDDPGGAFSTLTLWWRSDGRLDSA